LSLEVLEANGAFLVTHRELSSRLEGHTDERGGREYNLALGQRRAESVRRGLLALGVPPLSVEAVSFGEERPAVPGHDEAAWAWNRRVDIFYVR
jgi:peptidoglycan-associated lipoprotein